MDNFYELASKRRSIRKYEDKEIPLIDIEYFIKAAVTAPSGCNSQNWKFLAVKNKNIINQLAEAVNEANNTFYENLVDDQKYIQRKGEAATFFKNAPLVITVFMSKLEYYDPKTIEIYHKKGYDHTSMMTQMSNPDVLSIGAAVQNMLLAIQEKEYGACWMNEPTIAGKTINSILGVSEELKFMSLISIGYPACTPRNKTMKDFNQVLKIIE
ncbi:MAG TPA: nitroreductase family protein [Oscillospiraceae bacterium]|nr:nitroreductase family protein [Oscillospiraceae bacterium]